MAVRRSGRSATPTAAMIARRMAYSASDAPLSSRPNARRLDMIFISFPIVNITSVSCVITRMLEASEFSSLCATGVCGRAAVQRKECKLMTNPQNTVRIWDIRDRVASRFELSEERIAAREIVNVVRDRRFGSREGHNKGVQIAHPDALNWRSLSARF